MRKPERTKNRLTPVQPAWVKASRVGAQPATGDDSGGARNADCDTEDDLVEIAGEIYKIN